MSDYHRPGALDDALALLARRDMIVAAGCTDLFPATRGPALRGAILDITGIGALNRIEPHDGGLRIGACVTWSDLLHADLPPALDMLKQAAREVGSAQIQNAGTVVGNICNASPAADGMPPLLALDARVELASAAGRRTMALGDFVTGVRRTALSPGELVVGLTLPQSAMRGQSRFLKLGARRYLVISIAMVAARLVIADGRVDDAALSVGACGPVATRLPGTEAALRGQPADDTLALRIEDALVAPELAPIADIRADAAYRVTAAGELLRRAVADLTRSCGEAA